MKPRNLLLTQTAIATLLSISGSVIVAVTPIAESYFVRRAVSNEHKEDIKDYSQAIQAVLGIFGVSAGAVALNGRYKATPDMYTPEWMGKIGRNIQDVPADAPLEMVSADSIDYTATDLGSSQSNLERN